MEWQAVVLAVQILLLAAGWLLFQRARGELSARAAETPVLAEVKALQKNVKQLLTEIESMGDRQAMRIEQVCSDAGIVLDEIERQVRDAERCMSEYEQRMQACAARLVPIEHAAPTAEPPAREGKPADAPRPAQILAEGSECAVVNNNCTTGTVRDIVPTRRDVVFSLADSGLSPAAIARTTRLSEGEVETLLGLRIQK